MSNMLKRTWVEIDLDNIRHNFMQIKRVINPATKIMCVVKADAYGHGADFLAKEYELMNADWFAVSNIEEAVQLREHNIKKPILILGYTPLKMIDYIINFDITPTVLSDSYAKELSDMAVRKGKKINVHVKLDTGMSRIGLLCQNNEDCKQAVDICERIYKMPGINLQGIFTHFAVADEGDRGKKSTVQQYERFKFVEQELKKREVNIELCHCCNSGGIIDYPEMQMDMVRAGIILYGLMPSTDTKNKLYLKPAMQLKTVVSQVKNICAGTSVSYGAAFVSDRAMKVATVTMGYADGYLRQLSNSAYMLVSGKKAKVIGRICMDQLMLDVTGINVEAGDIVTVFGEDGGNKITVEELSRLANTISYELICLVSKRVSRVYYKNGKKIASFNYICRLN